MPSNDTLSVRVDPKKARAIDKLARATDRPRSWHLEQALDAYLEAQAWQVERVQEGLAELGAGKSVAHEDVAAWLSRWGTSDEGEPPG
ncbi:MAG: CopG family transcriptional regulator [Rhodospirillaceae bacterium]|jgi:predicted transcriptional regulator|nr:CopG family transcriptional regulator [Rhodospirillaceae bacterium]|tara:strand:- start:1412 stop:1675 length:264 start_codon:yes stop_codon:yes gene_type:complete